MIIQPVKRIKGSIKLPGDKSISHRAAMVAALADGSSRIENYSTSADCAATISCLRRLGVRIEQEGATLTVHGAGSKGLRQPDEPLDCANSGTTMRLLAGILAGQPFASTLTGDTSLVSRPMQRIIEPLEMMGAEIAANESRAPLTVKGRQPLRAIEYELLVASAQVKSCILLAGLNAEGRTLVIENAMTRDHTERMLGWFDVPLEAGIHQREGANSHFASVSGPLSFNGRNLSVPGDISSAVYFIAAAALLQGSSLTINNVGVNPTRIAFIDQLRRVGFDIEIGDVRDECNEPTGSIGVRNQQHPAAAANQSFLVNGLLIPQLIDELPLLAVVGSQIEGGIEIRDARELRVKESDRIASTVAGLRAMGAEVEEFDDGLRVQGGKCLRGAEIDSRGDHRIAMAFAVAGLLAEGETKIKDAECVGVSFPEFFELLHAVAER